jgi:divalent metal cation (Fe/Co/Zn/Cd) transporter
VVPGTGPGTTRPLLHDADPVRAALRVSLVSVAWTAGASTASVALGVVEASAVLVALGGVGLVDLLGSVALAFHFRHALRHEHFSERRERLAHHAVSLGLVVVGLVTAAGAGARLIGGQASHPTIAAVLLAAASLVVLALLAWRKRALGRRLRSRALVGDGHLSAIGAVQAAVALTGIGLTRAAGVDWADAAAALAVGLVAVVVGVVTWRAEPQGA